MERVARPRAHVNRWSEVTVFLVLFERIYLQPAAAASSARCRL